MPLDDLSRKGNSKTTITCVYEGNLLAWDFTVVFRLWNFGFVKIPWTKWSFTVEKPDTRKPNFSRPCDLVDLFPHTCFAGFCAFLSQRRRDNISPCVNNDCMIARNDDCLNVKIALSNYLYINKHVAQCFRVKACLTWHYHLTPSSGKRFTTR